MTNIKYPVAYNFTTHEIVWIGDVSNTNKQILGCPSCKTSFISVLNHPTPHFRHKPNARCSMSPETYLHWVTKVIFKRIEKIEIPELWIDDLPEKQRQNFQLIFNKVIDTSVPETLRADFRKELKKNLSDSRILVLDKINIEKEFETISGKVRIDIVAHTVDEILFIEPFLTNPIDIEKKSKLRLINIPTLSIDLKKFIDYCGPLYSLDVLKRYLISKNSKKWIHLNEENYNEHIKNYENYLKEEVEKKSSLINSHLLKINKLSTLQAEKEILYNKIALLKEQVDKLQDEILDLKNELGINY